MRTLSPDALRGVLAQETDEVYLICLTISHAQLPQTYRWVNDPTPLVRGGQTFEPCAFSVNLPPELEDAIPQTTVTLDNVDGEISKVVRSLTGARPQIRMELVTAADPNTVEAGPFDFAILDVNYDVGTIRGTLGLEDDLLNTAFPSGTYTPSNSPGLFL